MTDFFWGPWVHGRNCFGLVMSGLGMIEFSNFGEPDLGLIEFLNFGGLDLDVIEFSDFGGPDLDVIEFSDFRLSYSDVIWVCLNSDLSSSELGGCPVSGWDIREFSSRCLGWPVFVAQ